MPSAKEGFGELGNVWNMHTADHDVIIRGHGNISEKVVEERERIVSQKMT